DDLLTRGLYARANDVREDAPKPWATREHVAIRAQAGAVAEADLRPLPVGPHRCHRNLAVGSTNSHQLACDRVARVPRQQIPTFVFQIDFRDRVEADLRPTLRASGGIHLLVLQFELAEEWQRLPRVAVICARHHPEYAGASVELLAAVPIPLAPQRERSRRHLDVFPCRTVDRSDDPRFSAGARTGVSRTPRIDERHLRASPAQVQSRPAPEGACANNGHTDWRRASASCRNGRRCRENDGRLQKL